jgi:integrase
MDAVEQYVQLRRIGGFKFNAPENLLRSFVKFATTRGEALVSAETSITWAAQGSSLEARETRLRTVVAFARHCRAENAAHEIPPVGVFGKTYSRHPVAHIFSAEEVRLILDRALELQPKASLRPHTCHTVFGLLAATGLRISEALHLRFGDLTRDGLFIRETKFKKSRLVPIHATTTEALQRYSMMRRRIVGEGDHIFVGMGGQRFSVASANAAFREVLTAAGLATVRRGRRPRLHDLRHTWAVRALESSPREVVQIDRHMRAVTTYLGHVSVATGFWYLHATPFLMKRIADACAEQEEQRS